jgi:hypothetical protein
MATTNKMGIPYPASTDLVTDGATNMKDIADQVDFKVGYVKVIPTVTGTGATVASNGTITVASGSTSVTITCFTADFEVYDVVISDLTFNLDSGMLLQLRTGTSTSATGYYVSSLYGAGFYNGAGVTGASGANQANFDANFLSSSNGGGGGKITLFNPFLAKPTSIVVAATDPRTGGNGRLMASGFHNVSTSYNQLVLSSPANFTRARIAIYAYNI